MKIVYKMKRFNPVSRGTAAEPLVQVIDTFVIPDATFGSDDSWPGISRPTVRGTVTSQTSFYCKLIGMNIRLVLRAALPVLRTTSNEVIHREGGIPPAKIILESNRIRFESRINILDSTNPF